MVSVKNAMVDAAGESLSVQGILGLCRSGLTYENRRCNLFGDPIYTQWC